MADGLPIIEAKVINFYLYRAQVDFLVGMPWRSKCPFTFCPGVLSAKSGLHYYSGGALEGRLSAIAKYVV